MFSTRSARAQKLHTLIFSCITGEDRIAALNELRVELSQTRDEDLTQKSVNGYSHLHDAIRIPYKKFPLNSELAKEISRQLYFEIISACRKRQLNLVLRNLLTSKSTLGISILQSLLLNADFESTLVYLLDLKLAVDTGIITKADYNAFIMQTTTNGYNHLCFAIKSKSDEILKLFLHTLKYGCDNGYIHPADFLLAFLNKSPKNINVIHLAANTGNLALVKTLWETIETLFQSIEPNPLYDLLTMRSHNDQMPACDKADCPDKDEINAYLDSKRQQYKPAYDEPLIPAHKRRRETDAQLPSESSKLKISRHRQFSRPPEELAKKLLEYCIQSDFKHAANILIPHPQLMFRVTSAKGFNNETITASPLQYLIKHYDRRIRELCEMLASDRHFVPEYLEHVDAVRDRMDYQIIINAYQAYNKMWILYQRGIDGITKETLHEWWLMTVGNVQRIDMPQHARQEHCGHSKDSRKIRWHKDSRFLHEAPVFGVVKFGITEYSNDNDYHHRYNDELGRDFAYFRDSDNILHTDLFINDVGEEIKTLERYFQKCKQHQYESTEDMRSMLIESQKQRRFSK